MATPTIDGQASVNGLLMGKETPYQLLGFNPWTRTNRSDQADHAFQDGAWSGREFTDAATIPMRIRVKGDDAASWLALHQALAAAFAPADADVELRFMVGGTEYLMFGRPRQVDPDISILGVGKIVTAVAFVALDPSIYSAATQQVQLTLPSDSGGLTFPATFPATITATVTAGRAEITNVGTRETGLVLRIDGPVQEPRVSLLTDDGALTLRFFLDLTAGQWLDVDTRGRTCYLNGTASRRGLASGDWPLLPPGTSELAFDAGLYDANALLTATWRDSW
jgi:Siphovirus-type tail component, C-terminal domain